MKWLNYFSFLFLIVASSCAPPRAITQSGKVTPHKQLKIGGDYTANIPTHFFKAAYEGVDAIANAIEQKDTLIYENYQDEIYQINKAVVAYSIDPLGMGYNLHARYGLFKRVDIGYKYFSGVHVFDCMYQFTGSTGNMDSPGDKRSYGAIGFQYSAQDHDMPSWFGLNKVQKILNYQLNRKDFLVPLVFSYSFGPEEKIGHIAYGIAYSRTIIKYSFNPQFIYDQANITTPIQPIDEKTGFGGIGIFLNMKLGYKYVYILTSMATYYQNYGTYRMLGGGEAKFKGVTFIPTIGIEVNPMQIYFDANKQPSKKNSR